MISLWFVSGRQWLSALLRPRLRFWLAFRRLRRKWRNAIADNAGSWGRSGAAKQSTANVCASVLHYDFLLLRSSFIVSHLGPSAGAHHGDRVRRTGRAGTLPELALPRVHESNTVCVHCDDHYRCHVAAEAHGADLQLLVQCLHKRHEQLVPVRSTQVHQLSRPSAREGVEGHPCHADGQACLASDVHLPRVHDCIRNLRWPLPLPPHKQGRGAVRWPRCNRLRRDTARRLSALRCVHVQLAVGVV